jgi:NADPH:quinone reductase
MTSPAPMQAAILDAHGAPFRLARIPRPEPGPGEALVRIHASGINPLDTKIHAGAAAHARHPLPAILGLDLAGVVEAVGADVTRFRPGDAVYGMTGGVGGHPGTLAEFAAVDADLLAPKPANLSMREAAALPLVFITAWEGLVDRAGVSAGQKVLVHGGAGGVGHLAVQVARAFGADVFATGSQSSREVIERFGATFIDYRAGTVAEYVARHTGGRGFDLVYDTVGGATLDASFEAVRRFGHVVSILGWGHPCARPALVPRGDIFRRLHAPAAAHRRGPRPPRRDPRTGRAARRGGQGRAAGRSPSLYAGDGVRRLSRHRGRDRPRQAGRRDRGCRPWRPQLRRCHGSALRET